MLLKNRQIFSVFLALALAISATACGEKAVEFDGNFRVTTPQIYISDFSEIKPGDNAPGTGNNGGPQIDILTVNETTGVPVNIQHVITVYAKALTDSGAANANEYLDGTMFYICNPDGTEASDKYFILDNKTAVQADEYTEENGDIIAVRYYLPGQTVDAPGENVPSHTIDSYLLGLSADASDDYLLPKAEMNVSVKTQASIGEVTDETDWSTVDSISLYSDGYDACPIDTNLISFGTIPVEETALPETAYESTEPEMEVTLPPEAETLSPVTTIPSDSQEESSILESETQLETQLTETTTVEETTVEEITTTVASTTENVVIYPDGMSVTNSNGTIDLNAGESFKIETVFTPENTTEKGLTYSSSDTNVASVDANGTITGLSSGSASISITSVNGMVLSLNVNVKSQTPAVPQSVKFDTESLTLNAGDSYNLSVSIEPQNIGDVSVTWTTSDSNVAYISSGTTITAANPGVAVITLTTENGITATCTVTVI